MKPAPALPAPDSDTPFERFENLFRAVVSVKKSDVEKEEAKERRRNKKKRETQRRSVKK